MKPFYCILLVIFSSCVALKPLKIQREDNISNKIRLDGIYVSSKKINNSERTGVQVFYGNGVLLHFGDNRIPSDCINYWKEYLNNKNNNYNDVPYWWGIYQIRGDSLLFESWYSTDYYYPTISYSGKVIDDTTIIINYESSILDTFKFVEFSPKPDSTNKFIK